MPALMIIAIGPPAMMDCATMVCSQSVTRRSAGAARANGECARPVAAPAEAATRHEGVQLDLVHRKVGRLGGEHVIERRKLVPGPRLERAVVQPRYAVHRLH